MLPRAVAALLQGSSGVALSVCDRYLTPIGWNALADGLYRHSAFDGRVQRNPLVRLEDEYVERFFGSGYQTYARTTVGAFRRALDAGTAPPHVAEIYAAANRLATFRRYWSDRAAGAEPQPDEPSVRHHPLAGELRVLSAELTLSRLRVYVRITAPADPESCEKFALLGALGGASGARLPEERDA